MTSETFNTTKQSVVRGKCQKKRKVKTLPLPPLPQLLFLPSSVSQTLFSLRKGPQPFTLIVSDPSRPVSRPVLLQTTVRGTVGPPPLTSNSDVNVFFRYSSLLPLFPLLPSGSTARVEVCLVGAVGTPVYL